MSGKTRQALAEPPLDEILRTRMSHEMAEHGATKRSALRLAIVAAVQSGRLAPGDRLPPETVMAGDLGISLGTVQAALIQLRDMGILSRRRGDGTRVRDSEGLSASIWHFRFLHRGTRRPFLPIDASIEVTQTTEQGPWSEHLGDAGDYTLIRRVISDDGDARIGAEMVLTSSMLPPGEVAASELKSTNIRTVLESRLKVKVQQVEQIVRPVTLDPRKAGLFGLPFSAVCLHIQARTFLADGRPFYHQDVYAPADELDLRIPDVPIPSLETLARR